MRNRAFLGQCALNNANIVLVDGTECQAHGMTRWVAIPVRRVKGKNQSLVTKSSMFVDIVVAAAASLEEYHA
jgi:hypothetical protein